MCHMRIQRLDGRLCDGLRRVEAWLTSAEGNHVMSLRAKCCRLVHNGTNPGNRNIGKMLRPRKQIKILFHHISSSFLFILFFLFCSAMHSVLRPFLPQASPQQVPWLLREALQRTYAPAHDWSKRFRIRSVRRAWLPQVPGSS